LLFPRKEKLIRGHISHPTVAAGSPNSSDVVNFLVKIGAVICGSFILVTHVVSIFLYQINFYSLPIADESAQLNQHVSRQVAHRFGNILAKECEDGFFFAKD